MEEHSFWEHKLKELETFMGQFLMSRHIQAFYRETNHLWNYTKCLNLDLVENLIQEMQESKDKLVTAIEIASRLIKQLKPLCQGIHLMPIGLDKIVPEVLEASGL